MEKNIQSLKIGERGRITRIDGPMLRERMAKAGIKEGTPVERLAPTDTSGCLEIKIGRRRITLGLGVAMKLGIDRGDKSVGLLEMNPRERGVISSVHGGQRIVEILRKELGIECGKVIEVMGKKSDRDFLVQVEGRRSSICEGEASKVLVMKRRRTQLNYLKTGDEAPIAAIATGLRARSMLKEFGIEEGQLIRILQITQSNYREPEAPLLFRVGSEDVLIGYGMAEKIWVQEAK